MPRLARFSKRVKSRYGTNISPLIFNFGYKTRILHLTTWEIGHPAEEFVRLEEAGEIKGSVLDVGCGTGEDALFLTAKGHETWGIDFSSVAINEAREKAKERGLSTTFLTHNVLDLHAIGRTFDTIIDAGLFHTLSDKDRAPFASSLASVLRHHGTYLMLCFSELQPGTSGPRRVTQAEITSTFGPPWHVNYIRPALLENVWPMPKRIRGWLSSISKE
jgi:2-polyprenyl-3-methyl-5-hydroxy-6-metoxy-1,4-benzoquinol methylase